MFYSLNTQNFSSFICKIDTNIETQSGSGVLLDYDDKRFMLLTCHHVIKNATTFTISLLIDNEIIEYTLPSKCEILDDDITDTAILIFDKDNILLNIPKIIIVKSYGHNEDCILSGYPK